MIVVIALRLLARAASLLNHQDSGIDEQSRCRSGADPRVPNCISHTGGHGTAGCTETHLDSQRLFAAYKLMHLPPGDDDSLELTDNY